MDVDLKKINVRQIVDAIPTLMIVKDGGQYQFFCKDKILVILADACAMKESKCEVNYTFVDPRLITGSVADLYNGLIDGVVREMTEELQRGVTEVKPF